MSDDMALSIIYGIVAGHLISSVIVLVWFGGVFVWRAWNRWLR